MTPRLPDFVVAGVRKAGTTWLDACLRSHPEIHLSPITKEVFYFDRHYTRGLQWYGAHFSPAATESTVGDVSPSYFAHDAAPARLADDLPHARVVIVLRDPIQRAWSDFVHYSSKGDFPKHTTFNAACDRMPSILDESRYGRHLARWLEEIRPEHLRVFVIEDAKAHPASFLSSVYDYLGVDASYVPPNVHDRVNEARRPRSLLAARLAVGAARTLHGRGLHRIVAAANRLGLARVVMARGKGRPSPYGQIGTEDRKHLGTLFEPDVAYVANYLRRDLTRAWSFGETQR